MERCNPSLLISYMGNDGERRYIQIDAGKNFKEQVLRWFVPYKIPRLDAVSLFLLFYPVPFVKAQHISVRVLITWGLLGVQLILTHEHADAILGLDDVRGVQPFNVNNDIPPMPVFVAQHTMDRFAPVT